MMCTVNQHFSNLKKSYLKWVIVYQIFHLVLSRFSFVWLCNKNVRDKGKMKMEGLGVRTDGRIERGM